MRPSHKVWKLGADIDTDVLAPGHAMKHGIDVVARYCLESVRPDFVGGVQKGDGAAVRMAQQYWHFDPELGQQGRQNLQCLSVHVVWPQSTGAAHVRYGG